MIVAQVVSESCALCRYEECSEIYPIACFHEDQKFINVHPDQTVKHRIKMTTYGYKAAPSIAPRPREYPIHGRTLTFPSVGYGWSAVPLINSQREPRSYNEA